MQRWMRAGCFETMLEDLRSLLREFVGPRTHSHIHAYLGCQEHVFPLSALRKPLAEDCLRLATKYYFPPDKSPGLPTQQTPVSASP
jgi:hypothetical protein